MELIIYTLVTPKEGEPYLKIKECEVIEKAGILYPKDKHSDRRISGYILNGDIGRLSGSSNEPRVVLAEPDLDKAKGLLKEHVNKELAHYKAMVELWESRLRAVEEKEVER